MKQIKIFLAAMSLVALLAAAPAAKAQTVMFVGVGSSAMWQDFAVSAYKNLAGTSAHHYTVKGSCTSGNCAQLNDSRSSLIPLEGGNLWVVWNSAQTKVWAYISVDSVVGNRAFFATPRAKLQIDSETLSIVPSSQTNLISSTLWGTDDVSLPSAIYNAINNKAVTAALTDIRPEDAKAAQTRIVTPLNTTNYTGLGYGTSATQLVGTQVSSTYTTSKATPVAFNLSGTDPFTGQTISKYKTISVGASPILFLVNRTNKSGLGTVDSSGNALIKDMTLANAQTMFSGTQCDTNLFGVPGVPEVPVNVNQREPLSGTMNTTEYTNFRVKLTPNNSQEKSVNPANAGNNPLNLTCAKGGGTRKRAIGTGEMVKSAVLPNADAIGYAFFSYGNVSAIAGSSSYGYLTLAGVDGINATYTNGQLPVCVAPCPATPGKSFPNVRNGTYRSWSILRLVTDFAGNNLTNSQALVTAALNNLNSTVPDFVPATPTTDGDPGLTIYRSHFTQAGITPNNGLSGQLEAGGDEGGCIETVGPAPGILQCHQ